MKKIILMLLIVSLFIVSCAPVREKTEPVGNVITTAAQFWPGQFWIDIAMNKGWFTEAGLNVKYAMGADTEFVETEKALADGNLVVHQLVLYDLIKFYNDGKDLVAVAATDISFGGDGIMANPGIETVDDLKGKKVGVDEGTYFEFILSAALDASGLALDDVITVQAKAEEIDRLATDIDAILVYEPLGDESKKRYNAKKIIDTSDIPGLLPDVITFHKDYVEQHPQDVQAYINVWHKTTEFIKEHPGEAFQIIADIYDVPIGDVQAFTQLDKILDLEDNKISFSYAAGFESLHGTARQINDFMIKKGLTDKKIDSLDFIDARFIRNVRQ
jgi:NitT/TauT family transport system substrate-binding protein